MTDELRALAAQVLDQYPGPEHASLQALIVALLDLVDSLANRVAELEAEAGRHSGNSSKPPSGDTLAQRQAQKARRQEWTNKGKEKRSKGKQPGAPGAHLAQVEVPDVTVLSGARDAVPRWRTPRLSQPRPGRSSTSPPPRSW